MDKKKVKELIFKAHHYIEEVFHRQADNNNAIDAMSLANASVILLTAISELSKSDWVSVEDGLPEYGENVLAISKDGYMNVSYRRKIPRDKISREIMDDNEFILNFNLSCGTITHWKPIEKLEG